MQSRLCHAFIVGGNVDSAASTYSKWSGRSSSRFRRWGTRLTFSRTATSPTSCAVRGSQQGTHPQKPRRCRRAARVRRTGDAWGEREEVAKRTEEQGCGGGRGHYRELTSTGLFRPSDAWRIGQREATVSCIPPPNEVRVLVVRNPSQILVETGIAPKRSGLDVPLQLVLVTFITSEFGGRLGKLDHSMTGRSRIALYYNYCYNSVGARRCRQICGNRGASRRA